MTKKSLKTITRFVCQACGHVSLRWVGKCESCEEWNTFLKEEQAQETTSPSEALAFFSLNDPLLNQKTPRMKSHINEFDRVCGGGLVPGSVVLVGGDPGIGKSTLLIQVMAGLSGGQKVLYVSGEEQKEQIAQRAWRVGLKESPFHLTTSTRTSEITATLRHHNDFKVVVIDSIQTLSSALLDSLPGTVGQIRASAEELTRIAKTLNIAIIFVGHVTKEGVLAGPRILEHMVDTVLYFEGERGHPFRLLRAVKNRFGATDEIGVFDMTSSGLQEVTNPSLLFLSQHNPHTTGSCVLASMEGTRPLLVEIQALVATSFFSTPKRAVVGWDSNRLAMILAVLEVRCGVSLGGKDVYLNVAGGLKIQEPAADLAVALALFSCIKNISVPPSLATFGEVGLSGEVRFVGHQESRIREAHKLGFTHILKPMDPKNKTQGVPHGFSHGTTIHAINHVRDLPKILDVL